MHQSSDPASVLVPAHWPSPYSMQLDVAPSPKKLKPKQDPSLVQASKQSA
jgi:hypothetical protein